MKKLSLLLLASVFTLSIYSCRETNEERTEDSLEEVGTDVERTTEDAAYQTEETVQEAGNEVEAEVEGTDDLQ